MRPSSEKWLTAPYIPYLKDIRTERSPSRRVSVVNEEINVLLLFLVFIELSNKKAQNNFLFCALHCGGYRDRTDHL